MVLSRIPTQNIPFEYCKESRSKIDKLPGDVWLANTYIYIHDVNIERVEATKFMDVVID